MKKIFLRLVQPFNLNANKRMMWSAVILMVFALAEIILFTKADDWITDRVAASYFDAPKGFNDTVKRVIFFPFYVGAEWLVNLTFSIEIFIAKFQAYMGIPAGFLAFTSAVGVRGQTKAYLIFSRIFLICFLLVGLVNLPCFCLHPGSKGSIGYWISPIWIMGMAVVHVIVTAVFGWPIMFPDRKNRSASLEPEHETELPVPDAE